MVSVTVSWNHCQFWYGCLSQLPRGWISLQPVVRCYRCIRQAVQSVGRAVFGYWRELDLPSGGTPRIISGNMVFPSAVVMSDSINTWRYIRQLLIWRYWVGLKLKVRAVSIIIWSCCLARQGTYWSSTSKTMPMLEVNHQMAVTQLISTHFWYLVNGNDRTGVAEPMNTCRWLMMDKIRRPLSSLSLRCPIKSVSWLKPWLICRSGRPRPPY